MDKDLVGGEGFAADDLTKAASSSFSVVDQPTLYVRPTPGTCASMTETRTSLSNAK